MCAKSCSAVVSALTWSISPPLATFSTFDASKFEVSFSTDVDRMNGIAAYLISEVWRKSSWRGRGFDHKGRKGRGLDRGTKSTFECVGYTSVAVTACETGHYILTRIRSDV